MTNEVDKKQILEAAIFAAGEPVGLDRLALLFDEGERPSVKELKLILDQIAADCEQRGVELIQVASGFRFQAKQAVAPSLQRLWERKPARYTRAFLETLALVAYRQPITRGEIEEVRGVAVSSTIMRQLLDREWIKVVGNKDVPGKPALFGTTKQFLDYFNLKRLADLPSLQEITDLEEAGEKLGEQLSLDVNASSHQEEDVEQDEVVEDNSEQPSQTQAATEEDIDAIVEEALAMADSLEEAAA